jgi:hypothetical protein
MAVKMTKMTKNTVSGHSPKTVFLTRIRAQRETAASSVGLVAPQVPRQREITT